MLLFFFRTVPQRMWSHFWKVSTQGLFVAMFWPLIPQFVCNCLFYWALYFNPIINIDLVVKEVRRLETQVFWVALPTLWGTPPASLTSELWCLSEEGLGAHNFYFLSLVNKVLLSLSKPTTRSSLPLPWSLWQQGLTSQRWAGTAAPPT